MLNDLKLFGIKFTRSELKLFKNHIKRINKRIPALDEDNISLGIIESDYNITSLSTIDTYKHVYGNILNKLIKDLLYDEFKKNERLSKGLFQIGPFNKWYRKLDIHNLCITDNAIYFPKQFEQLITKSNSYFEFIDNAVTDYLLSSEM